MYPGLSYSQRDDVFYLLVFDQFSSSNAWAKSPHPLKGKLPNYLVTGKLSNYAVDPAVPRTMFYRYCTSRYP